VLSLRYRPLQKVSYPRLGLLLTMVPIPVQAKSRSINLIRSSLRHLNLLKKLWYTNASGGAIWILVVVAQVRLEKGWFWCSRGDTMVGESLEMRDQKDGRTWPFSRRKTR
jgi:hypothetical protein